MTLLHKLLQKQITPLQTAGFFLSNLFGTIVILLGLQLYRDIAPALSSGESFMKEEYLIVSKRIEPSGSAFGQTYTFSPEEIEEIRRQPSVRDVGVFLPSLFSVSAGLGMKSTGLYFATEMFFEAVPDKYVDVRPDLWRFDPDDPEIPIVIPRNYLNLYNFGFAQSQKLPKLSEEMAGALQLDIRLEGAGLSETRTGRIAGFSDRLNTILVPEAFLTWANRQFAPQSTAEPARLILETDHAADAAIAEFLQTKGYEVENGKLENGRTAYFLRWMTGIVAGIGLLVCLLSFFLLSLSISLLLQKDRAKITTLLLLGYNAGQIARPYRRIAVVLNGAVLAVAAVTTLILRNLCLEQVQILFPQWTFGGTATIFIAGFGLFLVLSLLNAAATYRKIRRIGHDKA